MAHSLEVGEVPRFYLSHPCFMSYMFAFINAKYPLCFQRFKYQNAYRLCFMKFIPSQKGLEQCRCFKGHMKIVKSHTKLTEKIVRASNNQATIEIFPQKYSSSQVQNHLVNLQKPIPLWFIMTFHHLIRDLCSMLMVEIQK